MSQTKFAPWAEPIARRDREAREELLRFARSVPDESWLLPSPLEGWMCRDVLAHLAGDTGKWFAHILQSVLQDEPLDERFGPGADIDVLNELDLDARGEGTALELIDEIETDGRRHEKLLSRLTDDERHLLSLYSITLGEFLTSRKAGNRGGYDKEHLAHIQPA